MTGLSVRGVYARMPPGAGVLVVKINFYYIAGKVGGASWADHSRARTILGDCDDLACATGSDQRGATLH